LCTELAAFLLTFVLINCPVSRSDRELCHRFCAVYGGPWAALLVNLKSNSEVGSEQIEIPPAAAIADSVQMDSVESNPEGLSDAETRSLLEPWTESQRLLVHRIISSELKIDVAIPLAITLEGCSSLIQEAEIPTLALVRLVRMFLAPSVLLLQQSPTRSLLKTFTAIFDHLGALACTKLGESLVQSAEFRIFHREILTGVLKDKKDNSINSQVLESLVAVPTSIWTDAHLLLLDDLLGLIPSNSLGNQTISSIVHCSEELLSSSLNTHPKCSAVILVLTRKHKDQLRPFSSTLLACVSRLPNASMQRILSQVLSGLR
jgi:hypothetical protein